MTGELRFAPGDAVEACVDEGWQRGQVVRTWDMGKVRGGAQTHLCARKGVILVQQKWQRHSDIAELWKSKNANASRRIDSCLTTAAQRGRRWTRTAACAQPLRRRRLGGGRRARPGKRPWLGKGVVVDYTRKRVDALFFPGAPLKWSAKTTNLTLQF